MKLSKLAIIATVAVTLTGCITTPSKPICAVNVEVHRQLISVPIFAVQDVANREYLAGAPFYYWTSADQFHDMGTCEGVLPLK